MIKKNFKVIIILITMVLIFSCTTSGIVNIANNDSGVFVFDTTMTENLHKTMTAFGDIDESENIFSTNLVESFFTQAGLTLSSIIMENNREIAFDGVSNDIKKVLKSKNQPILLTERENEKIFTFLLDENTINSLTSLLTEDSLMYIDLLQAPLFTREEMTDQEYVEFIGALYGQKLSNDLKESYVTLEINIPKPAKEVVVFPKNLASIKQNNNKILFKIKLSALLANSTEARFEVCW